MLICCGFPQFLDPIYPQQVKIPKNQNSSLIMRLSEFFTFPSFLLFPHTRSPVKSCLPNLAIANHDPHIILSSNVMPFSRYNVVFHPQCHIASLFLFPITRLNPVALNFHPPSWIAHEATSHLQQSCHIPRHPPLVSSSCHLYETPSTLPLFNHHLLQQPTNHILKSKKVSFFLKNHCESRCPLY